MSAVSGTATPTLEIEGCLGNYPCSHMCTFTVNQRVLRLALSADFIGPIRAIFDSKNYDVVTAYSKEHFQAQYMKGLQPADEIEVDGLLKSIFKQAHPSKL